MLRKPKSLRRRNLPALLTVAGGALVVGLLLLTLSLLNQEPTPVGEVSPPEVAEAPEPTTDRRETQREEEPRREEQAEPEEQREPQQEAAPEEAAPEEVAPEPSIAAVVPPSSPELYLTVPKMGLYGDYVASGADEATLMNGAGRVPHSGLPWQPGSNTYIASHVLGFEGTGSYMHFAALPSLTYGDEVLLSDANGNEYRYEVYEVLQVSIYDTWVIEPVGADVVSLQTCINPPAYDVRLVVRGKLVETIPA